MKAIKLSILLATMLGSLTTVRAQRENAYAIIQKHIDAIGGTDNWNKIKTMKMVGSVGDQEMSVTTTTVQDKASRIDFTAMGMSSYIIVTPKEGWAYLPMQGMDKVTPMTADQVKIQQGGLNIRGGLYIDKSAMAKAEFAGRDTIYNMPLLKVKITDKDGNEQTVFFDAATYYIVRIVSKLKIKGEDEEEAVTYSNFQKQPEGIVIAMTVSWPMLHDAEVAFKSVEINKPISDDLFKPGSVDKK